METTHDYTIGETEALDAMITVIAQSVAREVVGRRLDDKELDQVRTRIGAQIELGMQAVRSALVATLAAKGQHDGNGRDKMTPPELAKRWGISQDKVLTWIRSGELTATNIATRRGGRPRYLIGNEDIQAFEARRAVQHAPKRTRRGNHRDDGVIDFF